jgi:lipoprotein-releasing system permease protein
VPSTSLATFIAFRSLRARRSQTLITVLGVAVGVAVLIVSLSLFNGFREVLISDTLRASPELVLVGLEEGGLRDHEQLLGVVLDHPEVKEAAPYTFVQMIAARRADAARGITARVAAAKVVAVVPEVQVRILNLDADATGLAGLTDGGVVLGRELASSLGVGRGSEVLVQTLDRRPAPVTVHGTFVSGNFVIDSEYAFVTLPFMQGYLATDAVTGFHVRLADRERAPQVGRELARLLPVYDLPWQDLNRNVIRSLDLQKQVVSVVVFLIVLVAALGIANILVLTVIERHKEIAALRAMGATTGQIVALFALQGLTLGVAGTAAGVALGLAGCWYFQLRPFALPGEIFYITGLRAEPELLDFLWVSGMAVATSLLASLLPARRAAAIHPAAVLR